MWRFLSRILGTSKRADSVDPETAASIMQLHREHPMLGHRGLLRVLRDQGVNIEQADLKRFLRANGIRILGRDSTPPPSSTFPPIA